MPSTDQTSVAAPGGAVVVDENIVHDEAVSYFVPPTEVDRNSSPHAEIQRTVTSTGVPQSAARTNACNVYVCPAETWVLPGHASSIPQYSEPLTRRLYRPLWASAEDRETVASYQAS